MNLLKYVKIKTTNTQLTCYVLSNHSASVSQFYSNGSMSRSEYSTMVASLSEWSVSDKQRVASESSWKSLSPPEIDSNDEDDESQKCGASDDRPIQYNTPELSKKNKQISEYDVITLSEIIRFAYNLVGQCLC